MLFNPQNIKKALSRNLPGAASHKKMLPINRVLDAGVAEKAKIRHSSVLLLVFNENGENHVLLIKRPQHMKHHAGQIALPGGRIEKGETALETAIRETEEEIGVKPKDYKVLGTLTPLYVQVSRFQIHPFVAWLDKKPELKINPGEVEKTLSFPLKNIKATLSEVQLKTVSGPLKVPCFFHGDEIIWGATSMILSEFADALDL